MKFIDYWVLFIIFIIMPLNGVIMVNGSFMFGLVLSLCQLPFVLKYIKEKQL